MKNTKDAMPGSLERMVRPGLRFFYDQMHEVVRKHEKFPGDWWCRGVDEDTGLWAFSERTILERQRPNAPHERPPTKTP